MGLEKIDYIKIDVEGAEILVLKGGIVTIANFQPKLIIECEGGNFELLKSFLRGLNYECWVLESYEKEAYFNLLCEKKLEGLNRRNDAS
ncbi:MAG: FkbM family methyltransferase [Sulfolobales archaeon]|nr:FkbM family methyltransferase [Sulfolobales archaeon]